MGFLGFLTKRSASDGKSERSIRLRHSPSISSTRSTLGRRVSLERIEEVTYINKKRPQQTGSVKPYFLGVRDYGSSSAQLQTGKLQKLPSSGSKLRDLADSDARSLNYSVRSEQVYSHANRSTSTHRTSRYVDLLDAQGTIKPYNFHSRVQATGARDYGEDVAERNMGENGVDVLSPASQAFYASTNQSSPIKEPTISEDSHLEESDEDEVEYERMDRRRALVSQSDMQLPSVEQTKQPRDETSGLVSRSQRAHRARSLDAPTLLALTSGSGLRRAASVRSHMSPEPENLYTSAASMKRQNRSRQARHWISTERADMERENEPERQPIRQPNAGTRNRSISPPSVPRYRPSGLAPASHHAKAHRHSAYSLADNKSQRETDLKEFDSPRISRVSSPTKNHDIAGARDGIAHSKAVSNVSSLPEIATQVSALQSVASGLQNNLEWQAAIRKIVEQSLATLPISTDLKTLLEQSQKGIAQDDLPQNIPVRDSSLRQASVSCSTPTTDMSDYASSHNGRPQSRHTAATSVDSSIRVDFYKPTDGGMSERANRNQANSPLGIVTDPEESGTFTPGPDYYSRPGSKNTDATPVPRYSTDIMEIEEYECLTSDYSDVDSFTEKRKQILADDESLLFKEDDYGDLGSNLPGIAEPDNHDDCSVCAIMAGLPGGWPKQQCTHSSVASSRERLRALGYDYDTDESEVGPEPVSPNRRTRTKKITAGSGGGLRRLVLVDDRIDEDSAEELDDRSKLKREELRRRLKATGRRQIGLRKSWQDHEHEMTN